MTPEGRIKAAARKTLKSFPGIYNFMPVPSGYGQSSLDEIICVRGMFVAVEYKAPGKVPTPRQEIMIEKIQIAGGIVYVCDSIDKATHGLKALIQSIYNAPSTSQLAA